MKIRGVITAAGLSIAVAAGVTAVAQAGVSGHKVAARAKSVSAATLDSSLPSPNGAYFAAHCASYTCVRLYSRSGKELMSYSPSSAVGTGALAWSRDSRFLAVSAYSSSGKVVELAIIDTHTMTAKTILDANVATVSFAPAGVGEPADELVFDEYSSVGTTDTANLFETKATGGAVKQLTTNGVSATPVWGRRGIFFDRLTFRSNSGSPSRQIWLLSGGKARQLTRTKIGSLDNGFAPIAVSANGNRLIASDCVYTVGCLAWEIQLKPFISKGVVLPGTDQMLSHLVYPEAISRDGTKLLVEGQTARNSSKFVTEWVPFGGGKPHKVTNPALQPIWNW